MGHPVILSSLLVWWIRLVAGGIVLGRGQETFSPRYPNSFSARQGSILICRIAPRSWTKLVASCRFLLPLARLGISIRWT